MLPLSAESLLLTHLRSRAKESSDAYLVYTNKPSLMNDASQETVTSFQLGFLKSKIVWYSTPYEFYL